MLIKRPFHFDLLIASIGFGKFFCLVSVEEAMESTSFVNDADRLFLEKVSASLIFGLSLQIGHHQGLLGVGLMVSRSDQFEIKGIGFPPLGSN